MIKIKRPRASATRNIEAGQGRREGKQGVVQGPGGLQGPGDDDDVLNVLTIR